MSKSARRASEMQRLIHRLESGTASDDEVRRAKRFIKRALSKRRRPWSDRNAVMAWEDGRRHAIKLAAALERHTAQRGGE